MSIDTIERLETEIAEKKESLKYNVDELQERARDVVDWRAQVGRHPFAMIGAVAVGGVLVAAVLRPGPRTLRGLGALAGSVAPHAGRQRAGRARKTKGRRASDRRMQSVRRVARDARQRASQAASAVADRLHIPTPWEDSVARRPKHHTT
jgi:ElaB/YqjD/DUF883 family membrane-anchored ribosome-binding protein